VLSYDFELEAHLDWDDAKSEEQNIEAALELTFVAISANDEIVLFEHKMAGPATR